MVVTSNVQTARRLSIAALLGCALSFQAPASTYAQQGGRKHRPERLVALCEWFLFDTTDRM